MDLNSLLNSAGLEKVKKHGPDAFLWSAHFKSIDAYMEYRDEKEIAPLRNQLLSDVSDPSSIDPVFLKNLCKVLVNIQDDLQQCERRNYD